MLTKRGCSRRTVFVGHSFGCFVVCAFAAKYPDRTAGLVLIDPPAASEWRQPSRRQARLLARGIRLSYFGAFMARLGVVRACLSLLTGGAPRVPATLIKGLGPVATAKLRHLVDQCGSSRPTCIRWCRNIGVSRNASAPWRRTFASCGSGGIRGQPVRAAGRSARRGLERPAAGGPNRRASRALAPSFGGRHVVAAGSGHWIQFDEPDVVVGAIREVVDRTRQT